MKSANYKMNSLQSKYAETLKEQLLFFFFVMCFVSGTAQREITTTEVLLGAQQAEQMKLDSVQAAFLKDYNHNLPFIDNLEMRSETRDFLLNKQEIALRLKTNSIREILANKKVYRSKISAVDLEAQINYRKELENRYNVLIDHIFNQKLKTAYQEKKIQLEDKLTILEHTVYDESFDVKDVVETEDVLFETQTNLAQLEELESYQNKLLKLMVAEDVNPIYLNSYDLIAPTEMMSLYSALNPGQNMEIQRKQLELETIASELKLDVAESKKIIDFVQAKYVGRNTTVFEELFSVSMGINLPFFGKARQQKSDHYFDQLEVEGEIRALEKKQIRNKEEAFENFKNLISNCKSLKDQIENSSVSSLLSTYKKIEGVDPLVLIVLKISEYDKKIELLKLEYKLYKSFIEMLVFENVLEQKPLRNYLSSTPGFSKIN